MGPAEAFSMMTLFISGAAVVILRGPLGKALAERVAGRVANADPAVAGEIDRLHNDLEDMKQRLSDAEERLDFTERLLAQQRQQGLEPGGR